LFGRQSETIEASLQELNAVRSHVLDYFGELQIPQQNFIFSWETNNVRDRTLALFLPTSIISTRIYVKRLCSVRLCACPQ
jgi:hypothetical protein